MNVTWPFAELWTAPERLVITAQMLGTYSFKPEQVLAVEPCVIIPILGWGIRVRHCVADYPERIIFWSFANPHKILRGVRASGFLPAAGQATTELAGAPMDTDRGFPIRWPMIIGVVVAWNALLLLDFAGSRPGPPRPGWLSCLALALVFSLSLGALVSPAIQTLVLKPNRSLGEIRPFLRVLALVSGLMLLFFLVFGSW